MRIRTAPFLAFVSATVAVSLCGLSTRAQIVNDGATNTLSNVTNTIAGDVIVGTNGSFTLLILSDNSLLTNSVNGLIGRNVTAKSNEMRLISPTARWQMGGSLSVGSNGAMNRLVVSNGAFVENNNGTLATLVASSNNFALVTGSGSLWSNRLDLLVGGQGRGNQLIVSNGGWVTSRSGNVGNNASASNNFALVTGNGSVWSNRLNLKVGFLGPGNRLGIEAGGLVHCDAGAVGDFSSASNSEALVTGPGSLWTNVSFLTIGSQSRFNRLVVSNGATVWSGSGSMGGAAGSNNQVVITGVGSAWRNQGDLVLGGGSMGNRVDVSDGGAIVTGNGTIGSGFGANNNTAVLTGSGSVWNSQSGLIVGAAGNSNVLIASNGATVLSSNATIGVNGSTANNNLAAIIGPGTLWSNRNDLLVGSFGAGNRLQVDSGATLLSGNLFVGFNSISASNRVAVNGGTLRVTNAAGTGVLDVRRGTNVLNAGLIDVDRLIMTNAAGVFNLNGGLLISRGAVITNMGAFVVGGSTTNPATWDVRAGPGVHAVGVPLSVGHDFSFNRMFITNGATLNSVNSFIGANIGGNSNSVLLSGSGSKWAASGLSVGYSGAFNRLVVSNGATVQSLHGEIGNDTPASNNLALVTGAGSLWTNGNDLYVGQGGSGNQLIISNGGTVFAQVTRFLGHNDAAVSNTVLVTGAGSAWLGPGNVEIGGPGVGNSVIVSQGGRVEDGIGIVGSNSSSSNNLAVVTGAGSVWSNATDFYVGRSGSRNQLLLSNGGQLRNNSSYIGFGTPGNENRVVVSGPGTIWNNVHTFLGFDGSDNHLVISNGGFVTNGLDVVIGGDEDAESNVATLSGAGTRWAVNRNFEVGYEGEDNELRIQEGASLVSGRTTIGVLSGGNLVEVSGPGTTWTNLSNLEVGFEGSGNALLIADGATVVSSNVSIGTLASANGNGALVSGSVRWLTTRDFYLGSNGAFNVLVLGGGGLVANNNGIIGFGATSISNQAFVSGTGTLWTNGQELTVGEFGHGNRLELSDGARLESKFANLGTFLSASNNQVVVDGPGTLWRVEQFFSLGNLGSGNRLVITNGGRVNGTCTMGNVSANNEVVVTGSGSSWSNASLTVGSSGSGNRLTISDGAEVVTETFDLILGRNLDSTNNRIVVNGGALRVRDLFSAFDIRRGTNVLDAGLIDVQHLRLTNLLGLFEFNGGTLITRGASISNGQEFVVGRSGVPTVWHLRTGPGNHAVGNALRIGQNTSFCQMFVTNGAVLTSVQASIGFGTNAHFNTVTVAGPGSRWNMGLEDFDMGESGSGNALVISNGGWVTSGFSDLGENPGDINNQVVVTGSNSLWQVQDGLRLGREGAGNRVVLTAGGMLMVSNALFVGAFPNTATNNLLHVLNGSLLATNGSATGTLEVRSGTNRFDAGLIRVDRLRLTNTLGRFEFNGGSLFVGNSTINNGQPFRLGNGVSPATLALTGNGTHSFSNGLNLVFNATLTGNGSVSGFVLVQPGGTLAPGASVGKITFSDSPLLQGATVMEISRNGVALTNDQIQVATPLTFGGILVVTDIGPSALAAGDRFQLFNAPSFAGGFSAISLPPLAPGLGWINKLLLDGSIEVALVTAPKFAGIHLSGTNIILIGTNGTPSGNYVVLTATNVALPSSNWVALVTNQFNSGGGFLFTNGMPAGEPQRYFRIQTSQ